MEHRAADAAWPGPQSRFELAPPRRFLLPAVLLLLSEEPGYGYHLAKGLQGLRFGRVDRPSVYRALAQLERDGLVESWAGAQPARPAGSTRSRRRPAVPARVDGRDQAGARQPRPGAASIRRHGHDRRGARRGGGRLVSGDGPPVVVGGLHGASSAIAPGWARAVRDGGRTGWLSRRPEVRAVGVHVPSGARAFCGAHRGPLIGGPDHVRSCRHQRDHPCRGRGGGVAPGPAPRPTSRSR